MPARPVPSFPLPPLLPKPERFKQGQRCGVVRVYLCLDSIQRHISETPGDDCLESFFHVSTALMCRSDFVADGAGSPVSIPAKQAAGPNQSWLVFQLQGPACTGNRVFPPLANMVTSFAAPSRSRIGSDPNHRMCSASPWIRKIGSASDSTISRSMSRDVFSAGKSAISCLRSEVKDQRPSTTVRWEEMSTGVGFTLSEEPKMVEEPRLFRGF